MDANFVGEPRELFQKHIREKLRGFIVQKRPPWFSRTFCIEIMSLVVT
jgi:hypothetical protein